MNPDNRHWTDEDILSHVYGAETAPEAHLHDCGVCRQRVAAVRSNLDAVRAASPIESAQFFDVQRRKISTAMQGSHRRNWSWRVGSALAATTVMAVVLLTVNAPSGKPVPQDVEQQVSDAELYRQISALVEQDEPRAGQPIRALFKEKSQ